MLVDALAPLVDHHRSLGRRVKVVEVDDIYDVYSGGVVDARPSTPTCSARSRGSACAGSSSPARTPRLPRRGRRRVDRSRALPVRIDGPRDLLRPDRPGVRRRRRRRPARRGDGTAPGPTPEEMSLLVDKTLAASSAARDRSVLLVSDAADGIDYAAVQDGVAERFRQWDVRRADTDRLGVDGARAEMLDAFADGTTYALYLGHSSSHEWGQLGLFDSAAAADVSTPGPTIVAQFGCWNTYYPSPYADSIATDSSGTWTGAPQRSSAPRHSPRPATTSPSRSPSPTSLVRYPHGRRSAPRGQVGRGATRGWLDRRRATGLDTPR